MSDIEEEDDIPTGINETSVEILREDAKLYDQIDSLINDLKKKLEPMQKQLRELTLQKKKLQQSLCKFMSSNNVGVCNLPKTEGVKPSAIKYVETNVVAPLTQAQLKESLVKFFNGPDAIKLNELSPSDRGLFLFNYLFSKENRQKIVRSTIKKVEAKEE
jgi:hypothetical protein